MRLDSLLMEEDAKEVFNNIILGGDISSEKLKKTSFYICREVLSEKIARIEQELRDAPIWFGPENEEKAIIKKLALDSVRGAALVFLLIEKRLLSNLQQNNGIPDAEMLPFLVDFMADHETDALSDFYTDADWAAYAQIEYYIDHIDSFAEDDVIGGVADFLKNMKTSLPEHMGIFNEKGDWIHELLTLVGKFNKKKNIESEEKERILQRARGFIAMLLVLYKQSKNVVDFMDADEA